MRVMTLQQHPSQESKRPAITYNTARSARCPMQGRISGQDQSNSPIIGSHAQPHIIVQPAAQACSSMPMRDLMPLLPLALAPLPHSARYKHTWFLHMLCPSKTGTGHGSVICAMPVCCPIFSCAWLVQGPLLSTGRGASARRPRGYLTLPTTSSCGLAPWALKHATPAWCRHT